MYISTFSWACIPDGHAQHWPL